MFPALRTRRSSHSLADDINKFTPTVYSTLPTTHQSSTHRLVKRLLSSTKMFDENFSFLSSTADPVAHLNDSTSTDISPFTSRCSSPRMFDASHRVPSYIPHRRDSRFDSYRVPRHPSISALTTQLENHVLSEDSRPSSPVSIGSAQDSTFAQDEGFYDGPETPATTVSDYASDVDPTLWDLSMSDFSATSSPRPSLSLEAQATSSYTMRRRQRQALVRLQCLATRTPDLAMLIEECHPSSLPFTGDAFCWSSGKSRSNSSISLGATANGRIEKERSNTLTSVRKAPRMRKRMTR